MNVWLAESTGSAGEREIRGVFSDPGLAMQACQDLANDYLGAAHTPPLAWTGDESHAHAVYHHPAGGMWLFVVTRFEVDKRRKGTETP